MVFDKSFFSEIFYSSIDLLLYVLDRQVNSNGEGRCLRRFCSIRSRSHKENKALEMTTVKTFSLTSQNLQKFERELKNGKRKRKSLQRNVNPERTEADGRSSGDMPRLRTTRTSNVTRDIFNV